MPAPCLNPRRAPARCRLAALAALLLFLAAGGACHRAPPGPDTAGGWSKFAANPVLGGKLGTCFDACVLRRGHRYVMYFSWRPRQSIARTVSADGIHWSPPVVVLPPLARSSWQQDVNRPAVVRTPKGWLMWYTGQSGDRSWIGLATSSDGLRWTRRAEPVLRPTQAWEQRAIMCPDVLWDARTRQFRMWYSAGGDYEPNAIGYAVSTDGIHWTKPFSHPVFTADAAHPWERSRVTSCDVIYRRGWYYMFYIGFRDLNHAAIGLARSPDGIHNWRRDADNPLIRPQRGAWDADACYHPAVLWNGQEWMLWYNGRRHGLEQIGLALDPSPRFAGFPAVPGATASR